RLKLIDPTLLSLDSIDPGFARQLVKVIKNTTYQSEEKHYDTVNRYSAWVEKISHDGVLTEPELDSLKEIKKSQFTHLDSIWFLNFDSFAKKKSEARKELSDSLYDGKRPINFYFDSIARNENYKTYQKILAKKTDAKMKNVLLTTRDSALQNTVAFLKRRVTKIYQKNTNSTAGQSEYEEVIDSTKRNSLLSSIRE
ncbi:MAG TPA: hypothetical protein VGQ59_18740, partial [Cyclobacteriaceae bacterium]|nr:hypothetical protein [Cyclobacteriaceae bacterium]